jgi:hypothetical protein
MAARGAVQRAVAMADESPPPSRDDEPSAAPVPESTEAPSEAAAGEAVALEPEVTPAAAEARAAGPADAPAADEAQPPPERETTSEPRHRQPSRGRRRPRSDRPRQTQGRFTGPLPFQELRDAATSVIDQFGPRQALRDAFSALGDKERRDLSRLVAEDGDWRVRARNIAAGSLGAGRVGKALAAQQISMARIEDLWSLTLSKEEADQRLSRVRNARRRDERRAQRDAERERRSDRVSRADLEKAQDGRVGAQIRIIVDGEERKRPRDRDEPPTDEDKPGKGSDVLDRLGY